MNSKPPIRLVNRVYEVVSSNNTCVSNWGFYLFSHEFDKEFELRNKIGTIWICSLMDTMEAQQIELPKLKKEADEQGWFMLADAIDQLSNFCVLVGELLEVLSREEQIYLYDYRNQLVHAFLTSRHKDIISVKFFAKKRFEKEKIPYEEYHRICREHTGTLDSYLSTIIAKTLDRKLRYWQAVGVFQKEMSSLYQCLQDGKRIRIQV